MNLRRVHAIFIARNREFFRDRAAFGWNFMFPFLIVVGFAIVFGGEDYRGFKVGVIAPEERLSEAFSVAAREGADAPGRDLPAAAASGAKEAGGVSIAAKGSGGVAGPTASASDPLTAALPEAFRETRYLTFVPFGSREVAMDRLRHHKVDMVVEAGRAPHRYWVSETSPKGYVVERLFRAALRPGDETALLEKRAVEGLEIRYIDWLFPGILAMNMMFSALYGVGYVIVRYRRNGVLKRLKATPLTAMEFLTAQMLSRIFLLMFTLVVVWTGCSLLFSFRVEGSYGTIALIFLVGSLSLSSLGLLLAARGTSEEFVNGVLNFLSWPMMFLSEVWFSIEGAPAWVKGFSKIFPLTHILTAVRKVMNDGLTLADVTVELAVLSAMTLVCLSVAAALFSWNR